MAPTKTNIQEPPTRQLAVIGWTMDDLAAKMGLSRNTICEAFRDESYVSLRSRIEDAVGHPLFSTFEDFTERQKLIAFYGVDSSNLHRIDALNLARKHGIKLPKATSLRVVHRFLKSHERKNRSVSQQQ